MPRERKTSRLAVHCSRLILGSVSGAGLLIATAGAANLAYEVNGGLGYSDNIRRTESNKIDDQIGTAGLRLSLDERTARTEADIRADISYREYLDNTFDSEVVGGVAAAGKFTIVPGRFDWVASENFGQVLPDPFAPSTPDNRENINRFATGPDVTIALGAQTRVLLGGRYSLVTYEEDPLDSESASGNVALERSVSSATSVSLNYSAQRTEYERQSLNADYDQSEAYLRYTTGGARTTFGVDVGYTELDLKAADEKQDGLLFRLDAIRRISRSSTVSLALGQEYANSAEAFALGQSENPIGSIEPGQQTASPFIQRYGSFDWAYSRSRSGINVGVARSAQKYEGDAPGNLDQTVDSAYGGFTRELSTRTTLGIWAEYSKVSFDRVVAGVDVNDYEDLVGSVRFTWRVSGRLALSATLEHGRRSTDVAGNDFEENRAFLLLTYGSGSVRTGALAPEFAVDQESAP